MVQVSDAEDWVEFEYQPPAATSAVSFGGTLLVIAALAPSSGYVSVAAGLGAVALVAGIVRGVHRLVTAGCGVLFAAVVVAGAAGAPVIPVVTAAVATFVAYDAGQYAVRLGTQMGAGSETLSAELPHLGLSIAVPVVSASVGTGVFFVGPADQPGAVLLALLLAAVLLVSGLSLARSDAESM